MDHRANFFGPTASQTVRESKWQSLWNKLYTIGSEGKSEVTALLDTGFNGFLALPPELIDVLGLEQLSREQYMTASGAMHFTGIYEAVIIFADRRLVVDETVEATEHSVEYFLLTVGAPLVGIGLLWEFRVCFGYREGGEVTLEELDRT